MHYFNCHTHHKPLIQGEFVIRNGFLKIKPEQLNTLAYPVSVGLHPWHINQYTLYACSDALAELVLHPKVLAVGEIGLDKAIDIPLAKQLQYFDAQLTMAKAAQKPVIIHAVRSYNDFVPFLKKSKCTFVFHQFTGNIQQAKELMKYDVKFSFGKNLFDTKSASVFSELPDDVILLETDTASHLNILDIYNKASELKKMPLNEFIHLQKDTFASVFLK